MQIVPGLVFKARCDAFLKHEDRINSMGLFAAIFGRFMLKNNCSNLEVNQCQGFFCFSICLKKAFLLKDAQCSTLSQCQMVLKLYLEMFIPRNSFDRTLKEKEVAFCSLSKVQQPTWMQWWLHFQWHFTLLAHRQHLEQSLVFFPRMPSRSLHESSAVVEDMAFKCWA